ncbi:hypothetical protein HPP92_018716 [Vanilla planifolia]|uniref:HMA domain-containing protein n=1 Tax=Vanilla planifolia TaxID=51239 RepID=A0A835UQ79_VANPL|nr:hypothetical protein HPP92_019306 [Vanilla planifolia]KAG0469388.1 hypothetical protein HPP92_018716 [Vanilla planifolia]
MVFLASKHTLKLSPSLLPAHCPHPCAPATARSSCFVGFYRQRAGVSMSNPVSRRFPLLLSSLTPPHVVACISSSASLPDSGSGGGDGLTGGSGGGGGDGGSSGREAETESLLGQVEDTLGLGSEVIVLSVGGMTCGGCAASVKRILESQTLVALATVYLDKEIAVVLPAPEAKDIENWQQQLGEKLANQLTTCGFKSKFQGQEQANLKEF